jgi:branched-chain amino acid transport system substrate-binding protein
VVAPRVIGTPEPDPTRERASRTISQGAAGFFVNQDCLEEKTMRAFKMLSLLMLVVMLVTACQPTPAAAGTIKVAMLFPMTGDVATFGKSSKEGAQLAIDEWNAKGGVLGRQIEVIVGDSRCDAQEARNQAVKVIEQDKVQFIIGEVCSSASIPISEVANEKKVVQISPTSTNPKVTVDDAGNHKPYTFRACFLDPFQGDVLATFAFKDLGLKTAGIMFDQGNDYVRGLAEYIRGAYEKLGGEVKVYEAYTKDDTDFSATLSKVADAKVDVLFLPDYYNKVSLIGKQAKEKGITAVMMGGDGWDSAQLETTAVDGGYFSNHYSPSDPRPLVQNFIQKYKEKYGAAPDALAVLSYDAANILFTAITDAKTTDPEKVKDAMLAVKYEGISGQITMDKNGDPIKAAAITKVTGGGYEFVKFVAP